MKVQGFLVAAVAFLIMPASAGAATVSVNNDDVYFATYTAEAGEANQLEVSRDGADAIVRDKGAPVIAGNLCESLGPHKARCNLGSALAPAPFNVTLGNRADTADIDDLAFWSNLDAGPGADRVTGGIEDDIIDGGPGPDFLRGGNQSGNSPYYGDRLGYGIRTDDLKVKLGDRKSTLR